MASRTSRGRKPAAPRPPLRILRPGEDGLARNEAATGPLLLTHLFDADECAGIIRLAPEHPLIRDTLVHPVEGYRHALSYPIPLAKDTRWLFERVWEGIMLANEAFDFRLTGIMDSLLVVKYPRGGHLGWHTDFSDLATSARKVSLSIQLSPPDSYDGGALQFSDMGVLPFSHEQGAGIAFPTYLSHRVTRVTRGSRWVMLAWAFGPVFR
ncbi:MAG: 2OG-Fe(II) oxygenase [Betaproteobacteria bacterium]|nr:2OG-Fe(II) oxygenase [Betaproteobacteria bacterium]